MENIDLPENCTPIEAGQVKVGNYILLKNRPCKIYEATHYVPGKHGSAKVSLVGVDLISGKKCEGSMPGHMKLGKFEGKKREYQVINITEDSIDCVDEKEKEYSIAFDPKSEMHKALKRKFLAGETVTVAVIKVPVIISATNSSVEEIVNDYTSTPATDG